MPCSSACKLLLVATLLSPVSALAQGGGGGGGGGGGSAGGGAASGASGAADSGAGAGTGSAPAGRAGTTGNRAGGAAGGRIDGTVTPGPAMQGDDVIRKENTPGHSKADKKIDSICRGC